MATVALVFLALYSVLVLARPTGAVSNLVRWAMIATYFVFVFDYLARLYLADPRGRWFLRHLFDLAIIVLPFLRPLRLLSLAVVVKVLQRAVGHTIRGKVIAYTACGVVVIVYAASLAILDLERDLPGTKIASLGDALWWAATTVTTVGYGDVTPVSSNGRIVAAALMVGRRERRRRRHGNAGVLDRATRRGGGQRHRGRHRRPHRGVAGRDSQAHGGCLRIGDRRAAPRLW